MNQQQAIEKATDEYRDLILVWAWIKAYGGTINERLITLNKRASRMLMRFVVKDTYAPPPTISERNCQNP